LSITQYEILTEDWIKSREAKRYFEIEGSTIKYKGIDHSDNFDDPEEKVRAGLFVDLIERYQYKQDLSVIEFEKYHKIGHPHKKTDAKIDILVKKDDNPFMIFELKSPDDYEIYMEESIETQLFNVAAVENKGKGTLRYLIYYTRFYENGDLKEKILTIDYTKFQSYEEWVELGRSDLKSIPINYGIVRKPTYVKGGDNDLRIDVKKDELQRIRRDLHNILWGGGKYQNELFFNLVGLFLVKIYDEKETEQGKPYDFQVFQENGDPEDSEEIYKRMNNLYFKALKEYLGYGEAELNKIKDIVFDPPKVKYVIEVLEDISFVINKYDVIGDFFEGIVRGEFKQTKGQYLTHPHIIDFIIRALRIEDLSIDLINEEKSLPFIIDPACGSGAFLIHSMKLITSHILDNMDKIRKSQAVQEFLLSAVPEYRRNAWAHDYVYGVEIHGDLAAATKVNMVGHGDGSANIDAKDSLLDFECFTKARLQIKKNSSVYPMPVNEQFDVVISNPPFSVTVDRDTAKKFPACYKQGEKILRKLKKSNELEVATELLFIERWYQLLKPGGRLGVVLPESIFDTASNMRIRLFLFQHFHIKAIISLPTLAFAPYTQTKTNLLFAQKKTEAQVKKWNDLWEKYSKEYELLGSKVNKYFGADPLVKLLWEIIASYEKKKFVLIDEEDFNNSYVKLEDKLINETNIDIVKEKIPEFLSKYLKGHTEDFDEDLLSAVISRKRSFLSIIKEKMKIMQTSEFLNLLKNLLKHNFDDNDSKLSIKELKEKYFEMINLAKKDWWVFDEVAKQLSGNIFMAHAEEIGYKRGVRREEDRPNELFQKKEDSIIIDTNNPKTVLDHFIKSVRWD